MKKEKHGDLVTSVLRVFAHMGWPAWKNHVANVELAHGGWLATGRKGLADIAGIIPPLGRAIFVEAKVGKDEIRPHQVEFLDGAERAGAICMVVYGLDDFLAEIQWIEFNRPELRGHTWRKRVECV